MHTVTVYTTPNFQDKSDHSSLWKKNQIIRTIVFSSPKFPANIVDFLWGEKNGKWLRAMRRGHILTGVLFKKSLACCVFYYGMYACIPSYRS